MGGRGASSGLSIGGSGGKAMSALDKKYDAFVKKNYGDDIYGSKKLINEFGLENVDLKKFNDMWDAEMENKLNNYDFKNVVRLPKDEWVDWVGSGRAFYMQNNIVKYYSETKDTVTYVKNYSFSDGFPKDKYDYHTVKKDTLLKNQKNKSQGEKMKIIEETGREKLYRFAKENKVKVTRKMSDSNLRTEISRAGLKDSAKAQNMWFDGIYRDADMMTKLDEG